MKKKLLVVCLFMVAVLALCACGKKSSDQVVNPMKDSTYEEVKEKIGVDLPALQGATDVKYYIIDVEGATPMAEMNFVINGHKAYIRAVATKLTEKELDLVSPDAQLLPVEAGEASEKLTKLTNALDISGLYDEWDTAALQDVDKYNALTCRKDDLGFIAWIDGEKGILYNLCMESGADDQMLVDLATVFINGQK